MRGRRDFLALAAGLLTWAGVRPAVAQAPVNLDETRFDPKALPFPVVAVRGADAMREWERLRAAGKGWPVILGDELAASYLPESLKQDGRTVAEILKAAATLTFPASLAAMRDQEREDSLAELRQHRPEAIAYRIVDGALGEGSQSLVSADAAGGRPVTYGEILKQTEAEPSSPELGDWPATPEVYKGPGSLLDYRTERPAETVYIGLLPTADPAEAPAYLGFGGWNACPPPEHQVAVLRGLRERYGAELVACTHDTIELRVRRRPQSRDEAIALARDLYLYCEDNIDQGHETLSAHAAALMAGDWWWFWWD